MDSLWRYIIIGVVLFILIIVLLIVFTTLYNKNRLKKMHAQVEELFKYYKDKQSGFKFEASNKTEYDYIFETMKFRYYIKLVPNFNNQ